MKKRILLCSVVAGLVLTVPVDAAVGVATIQGTKEGSPIFGQATVTEKDEGIELDVRVANVPDPGKHGFHIHEIGSCADEGKAAGGHFNPVKVDHGYLPKDGHEHAHAGDMGNIDIAEDGTGALKIFLPGVYLKDKEPSVLGLSVILHEKVDDFGQPTGNAGGRIGCGIIEPMQEIPSSERAASDPVADPVKVEKIAQPVESK